MLYAILNIKKDTCWNRCLSVRIVSIPKVDAPKYAFSLMSTALPVCRQVRHFYFFLLFLLSRKVRNAIIKLPKDINKANIPMKIVMIS